MYPVYSGLAYQTSSVAIVTHKKEHNNNNDNTNTNKVTYTMQVRQGLEI